MNIKDVVSEHARAYIDPHKRVEVLGRLVMYDSHMSDDEIACAEAAYGPSYVSDNGTRFWVFNRCED